MQVNVFNTYFYTQYNNVIWFCLNDSVQSGIHNSSPEGKDMFQFDWKNVKLNLLLKFLQYGTVVRIWRLMNIFSGMVLQRGVCVCVCVAVSASQCFVDLGVQMFIHIVLLFCECCVFFHKKYSFGLFYLLILYIMWRFVIIILLTLYLWQSIIYFFTCICL